MNSKSTFHEEWPAELQKAVREYPRIVASLGFNQRVFAALAEKQAQQNKIDAFCDALDRIFERPLLKLLGTALFAILLAWCGANFMSTFISPQLAQQANSVSPVRINTRTQFLNNLTVGSGALYAWDYDTALQMQSLDIIPPQQKASPVNSNSTNKKETSCSPNEKVWWG